MTEQEIKDLVNTTAAAAAKTAVENYIKAQEAMTVSNWANSYWNEAVAAGIFDGTMPRGYLTREQASITYSKMGLLELSTEKDVSDWAKNQWSKACAKGLMDSTEPRVVVTREQLAVILDKLGLL